MEAKNKALREELQQMKEQIRQRNGEIHKLVSVILLRKKSGVGLRQKPAWSCFFIHSIVSSFAIFIPVFFMFKCCSKHKNIINFSKLI